MRRVLLVLACALAVGCWAGTAMAKGNKAKAKPKEPPSAEKVFAKLDTNHDGKLSKEEFSAKRKSPEATAKAEKHFEQMDKEHHGFLTLDEFKAAFHQGKHKKA